MDVREYGLLKKLMGVQEQQINGCYFQLQFNYQLWKIGFKIDLVGIFKNMVLINVLGIFMYLGLKVYVRFWNINGQ